MTKANNNNTQVHPPKAESFFALLASYYMEFLETSFHKRRIPKRNVQLTGKNNLKIGINLFKYRPFKDQIQKILSGNLKGTNKIIVPKGKYTRPIPPGLEALTQKTIAAIDPITFDKMQKELARNIKEAAKNKPDEFDIAVSIVLENARTGIQENFIHPFVTKIEKPLENLELGDIQDIFVVEDELSNTFLDVYEPVVTEIITSLIAKQKVNITEQVQNALTLSEAKKILDDYFSNYSFKDLYFELREIADNLRILDKQTLYLYFSDLKIGNNTFPVFYIPLDIEKQGENFVLSFDNISFINKKALEFVVQEYNREMNLRGSLTSIEERKIYASSYISDGEFLAYCGKIVGEISDYFGLKQSLDLSLRTDQKTENLIVRLTNNMHLCIFENADEALINDYEEILEALKEEGSPIAEAFARLVSSFIGDDPIPFQEEVHDDWAGEESPDRLIFKSPIPLNEEQRQILIALQKKDCNYVLVEGPPGTGKSHTITALVFEAIFNKKSVLVLSDKKEALDVVENKITDTLNKLRVDENFQNPVLRLDKRNYGKILQRSSISKIANQYHAYRDEEAKLKKTTDAAIAALKDEINKTVETSKAVSGENLARFHELEAEEGTFSNIISLEEISNTPESFEMFAEGIIFAQGLAQELENSQVFNLLKAEIETVSLDDLILSVDFILQAKKAWSELPEHIQDKVIGIPHLSLENLEDLKTIAFELLGLKSGLFGYLFKKKALNDISLKFAEIFKAPVPVAIHKEADDLLRVFQFYDNFHSAKKPMGFENRGDFIYFIKKALAAKILDADNLIRARNNLNRLSNFLDRFPETAGKLGLSKADLDIFIKKVLDEKIAPTTEMAVEFCSLRNRLEEAFNRIPVFDFQSQKENIEQQLTLQMAGVMDKRVLDFHNNHASTEKTLKQIIASKAKFPRTEFDKLKEAFPCIIAGIRDYAEYIPLEHGLFDWVIIDEASQVSIAQAFPALIRGKKVVVLGDDKQFPNVKAAHARSETNLKFMRELRALSSETFDSELATHKVEFFNIKKSILDFFQHIRNFDIMLKKHFRGYLEHISLSSRYFYDGGLQPIKIRGKPVSEVLQFYPIDHDGKREIHGNTNDLEAAFIIRELEALKKNNTPYNVGIITPHTDQQKYLSTLVTKHPDRDYFYDKLKLKVMTFDTCQGEERDIIYYSMVANPGSDKLYGVFPKDLNKDSYEGEETSIRRARLNVGFSRVRESMRIVHSKPIGEFWGAAGEALNHFNKILVNAGKMPSETDLDPKSPMEKKVLSWISQTPFYIHNSDNIEIEAQFEIGKFLKEMSGGRWTHPNYVADFLFTYTPSEAKPRTLVIEYDGFEHHFQTGGDINELNFDFYYQEDHVYRQKVLESYGYHFLRINRFNVGKDPVAYLNRELENILKKKSHPKPLLLKQ